MPRNEDELELKEGDIVDVMEKCDDGWFVGKLHLQVVQFTNHHKMALLSKLQWAFKTNQDL